MTTRNCCCFSLKFCKSIINFIKNVRMFNKRKVLLHLYRRLKDFSFISHQITRVCVYTFLLLFKSHCLHSCNCKIHIIWLWYNNVCCKKSQKFIHNKKFINQHCIAYQLQLKFNIWPTWKESAHFLYILFFLVFFFFSLNFFVQFFFFLLFQHTLSHQNKIKNVV